MNVELLEKVKAAILAEPEHFRMDTWSCGTAHCIAGWALKLSGIDIKNPSDDAPNQKTTGDEMPGDVAERLLELDGLQSDGLFNVSQWPEEFREKYESAEHDKKEYAVLAGIAAEAIDAFIAHPDGFGDGDVDYWDDF